MLVYHSPSHQLAQARAKYFRAMQLSVTGDPVLVLDAIVTAAAYARREHEIAVHHRTTTPLYRRYMASRAVKRLRVIAEVHRQVVIYTLLDLLRRNGMSLDQANDRANRLITMRCEEHDLAAQVPGNHRLI